MALLFVNLVSEHYSPTENKVAHAPTVKWREETCTQSGIYIACMCIRLFTLPYMFIQIQMNHFPITFTHTVKLNNRIEVNRHPLDKIKIKTFCRSFGLINRQTSSSMHDVHGHYAKVKLSVEANSSVVWWWR